MGLKRASKRSEVTAAREIIALLDLTATTVTADALHGNRATAAAIRARGGDYALAIKGNRGPLHRDMQDLMAKADPARAAATIEMSHGRHEGRRAWVTAIPDEWRERHKFDGFAAVARIDATRRIAGKQTMQVRYFALSRVLDPAETLRVARAHWTIENNQHWLLDVALAEDRVQTRNDHTAENIALLRRLALNLLRADPTKAPSDSRSKKQAGKMDTFSPCSAKCDSPAPAWSGSCSRTESGDTKPGVAGPVGREVAKARLAEVRRALNARSGP